MRWQKVQDKGKCELAICRFGFKLTLSANKKLRPVCYEVMPGSATDVDPRLRLLARPLQRGLQPPDFNAASQQVSYDLEEYHVIEGE